MLLAFSLLVIAIGGWAFFREGIFNALVMLVNVLIAGALAYNFWEPLADFLEPTLADGFLAGMEDLLVQVILFVIALCIMRAITNNLVPTQIEYPAMANQFGGAAVGLLIGYLAAGFLVCAFQTLPFPHNFLGFQGRTSLEPGLRRFLPPDRVWLALMRHAGAYTLSNQPDKDEADDIYDRYQTFDQEGSYQIRYLRYRRSTDGKPSLLYRGELDTELHRKN